MKFTVALFFLLSALPSAVHGLADQVGTTIEEGYNEQDLQDIQPPVGKDGTWKQLLVEHEETDFIGLHFTSMHIADSCTLYTQGSNGQLENVVQEFDAQSKYNNMEEFWAWSVESSTVALALGCATASDADNTTFSIDKYAVQADSPSPASICGPDDKVNAVCYKNTYSTVYNKAKAVCRIRIGGVGSCTGWLVGVSTSGNSLLLTNEHCISSQSDVDNSSFQFMAENPTCSGSTSGSNNGIVYGGKTLKKMNAGLDYALVELEPRGGTHAHQAHGYFGLESRAPRVNEQIYIPQHAGARMKQLGIVDTENSPTVCKVLSINQNGCTSSSNVDFRYKCDTEGGSSGSPVVSYSSNKIIGLHHCGGGCRGNMGTMMSQIYPQISGLMFEMKEEGEALPASDFWHSLFHPNE